MSPGPKSTSALIAESRKLRAEISRALIAVDEALREFPEPEGAPSSPALTLESPTATSDLGESLTAKDISASKTPYRRRPTAPVALVRDALGKICEPAVATSTLTLSSLTRMLKDAGVYSYLSDAVVAKEEVEAALRRMLPGYPNTEVPVARNLAALVSFPILIAEVQSAVIARLGSDPFTDCVDGWPFKLIAKLLVKKARTRLLERAKISAEADDPPSAAIGSGGFEDRTGLEEEIEDAGGAVGSPDG
ncbi:hypothetical protein DFJ74DRAFT_742847 [Hyaloraphidium curvatum]|nr:hypothetical protein DFJ74DRAFT_742847 [Hyaloraphidium curvatum]